MKLIFILWVWSLASIASVVTITQGGPNCNGITNGYVLTAQSNSCTFQAAGGGSAITALTGDVTATGPGSVAATIGAKKVLAAMLGSGAATMGWVLTADGIGGAAYQAASGGGITVGTTTITSGTDKAIPYNNAGVYGESLFLYSAAGTQSTANKTSSAVPQPITFKAGDSSDRSAQGGDLYLRSGIGIADGYVHLLRADGQDQLQTTDTGIATRKITAITGTLDLNGWLTLGSGFQYVQGSLQDGGPHSSWMGSSGSIVNAFIGMAAQTFIMGYQSGNALPAVVEGQIIVKTGTDLKLTADNTVISGGIQAANLATSSAGTTGTMCWTTGTGNVNVDTTTTCLLSAGKYKQDILPLDTGLKEVMALKPVSYQLKKEFNSTGLGRQVGFIAEDVQAVDDRLVSHEKDGSVHGVRYMQTSALLTKAIQQEEAQIVELQSRVSNLETQLATMQAAIVVLQKNKKP